MTRESSNDVLQRTPADARRRCRRAKGRYCDEGHDRPWHAAGDHPPQPRDRQARRVCEHVLVHTGQNFDQWLNDIFFHELGVRAPDRELGVRGAASGQVGRFSPRCDAVLRTNGPTPAHPRRHQQRLCARSWPSAWASRSTTWRRATAASTTACLKRSTGASSTTQALCSCRTRSAAGEPRARGDRRRRIYVTGNPIQEVLTHYDARRSTPRRARAAGVERGGYFLVTMHRAENVDIGRALAWLSRRSAGAAAVRHARGLQPAPAHRRRCGFGVEAGGEPCTSSSPWVSSTSWPSRGTRSACSPTAARCRRSAASSGCPP